MAQVSNPELQVSDQLRGTNMYGGPNGVNQVNSAGQLVDAVHRGTRDPNDALQEAGNAAGMQASQQYLNNLTAMAPNGDAMRMSNQLTDARNQNTAGYQGVQGAFQPQARDASGQQSQALGYLQNSMRGNGPSVAAVQQNQGLNQAQQGAAQAYAQGGARSGGSAASQFLGSLGAQRGMDSQAIQQGSAGRLNEIGQAAQGANGLSNAYTNNLTNNAALNTKGAAQYAQAQNANANLAVHQTLAADQAGNAYLSGLGNVATGGQNAALNKGQSDAAYNGAMTNGIASGVGAYMQGQQGSGNSGGYSGSAVPGYGGDTRTQDQIASDAWGS